MASLPHLVFTNSYGTQLLYHHGFLEAEDLAAVINAMPSDVSTLNRLDRILQEDKDHFETLRDMGRALRASGFFDSSNAYYSKALQQRQAKKDAAQREPILYEMAMNSLELKDGKSAAESLEKCLKDFPKSARRPETLFSLGKAYALDEKKDKARKALSSVIAEFPQSPAATQAQALLQSL